MLINFFAKLTRRQYNLKKFSDTKSKSVCDPSQWGVLCIGVYEKYWSIQVSYLGEVPLKLAQEWGSEKDI